MATRESRPYSSKRLVVLTWLLSTLSSCARRLIIQSRIPISVTSTWAVSLANPRRLAIESSMFRLRSSVGAACSDCLLAAKARDGVLRGRLQVLHHAQLLHDQETPGAEIRLPPLDRVAIRAGKGVVVV